MKKNIIVNIFAVIINFSLIADQTEECERIRKYFERDMKTEWESNKDFPLEEYANCIDYLKQALAGGVHPDARQASFRNTALQQAVAVENNEAIELLLNSGASTEGTLHFAKRSEMANKLIDRGAQVNLPDVDPRIPVHLFLLHPGFMVIKACKPNVLKVMLERGASQEEILKSLKTNWYAQSSWKDSFYGDKGETLEEWVQLFFESFENVFSTECVLTDLYKEEEEKKYWREKCEDFKEMIRISKEFNRAKK